MHNPSMRQDIPYRKTCQGKVLGVSIESELMELTPKVVHTEKGGDFKSATVHNRIFSLFQCSVQPIEIENLNSSSSANKQEERAPTSPSS